MQPRVATLQRHGGGFIPADDFGGHRRLLIELKRTNPVMIQGLRETFPHIFRI